MHNWRLLLLAFLAVLQPITSFTERNLVDGREQCCHRNSLLRDSRLVYGTSRFNKLPEDHRLSRFETREDRRYEVRRENLARENVLTRPSTDRRLVEFRTDDARLSVERQERATRSVRADTRRESIRNHNRRVNIPNERDRRVRDAHRITSRYISRDVRSRGVSTRQTRESVIRQFERDNRENTRDAISTHRITPKFRETRDSGREFRETKEVREGTIIRQPSRQEVARNEIRRVSREDQRIVRERVDERRARSESNLDSRRERQSRDRRVTDIENQRFSSPAKSMANIRQIRETSKLHSREEVAQNEIRRVSREDRRIVRERVDERRARSEPNLDSRRERQSRDRRVTDNENQRSSLPAKSMANMRQIRETSELQSRASRDSRDSRRQVRGENSDTRARVMSVRGNLREERRATRGPTERSRSEEIRRDSRHERASTRAVVRFDGARLRTLTRDERGQSEMQRNEYRTLSRKERVPSEMQRVESSRVADRAITRERNEVTERRDHRDGNRREARHSDRAVRMTRSRDVVERDISSHRMNKRLTENTQREINDARLRSNTRFTTRENFASVAEKRQLNQPLAMHFQYVLYVLQGIYLGGILLKMLSPKGSDKKSRGFSWLVAPRSFVKVD